MANRLDGLMVKEVSGVDRAANRRTFLITKRDTSVQKGEPTSTDIHTDTPMIGKKKKPGMAEVLNTMKSWIEKLAIKTGELTSAEDCSNCCSGKEACQCPCHAAGSCCDDCCAGNDECGCKCHACACERCCGGATACKCYCHSHSDACCSTCCGGETLCGCACHATAPVTKADPKPKKLLDKMKILLDEMMTAMSSDQSVAKTGTKEDNSMADAVGAATAPVTKADFDAVQKSNDELKQQVEALTKANNASLDLAKAEADKRETAEMIAKAEKDMPNVPGTTPNDLGPVLKRAKSVLTVDDYGLIEKALIAASAAVKTGDLLKEAGVTGGSVQNAALGQMEDIAKAVHAANPNMTKEQAFAKAVNDNPELYQRYNDEKTRK